MTADWIALAVGLLLTIGTGLFVASEFSLINLDRAEIEARQSRGESMLGPVISGLRRTATHLSSAQLGITLTTLTTGFLVEPALSRFLRPGFEAIGLPEPAIPVVATVVAVTIVTIVSMIIGELFPKKLALALPRQVGKIVIPLQLAFTTVFRPFVVLLNRSANLILRALRIEPKEELSSARTWEELRSLVRRSASVGSLNRETATLLSRTLVFSQHQAADVMTPRPRIVGVARTDTADAVLALARRTGFSRFPVYEEDIDDIVGLVHVKQALSVPRERRAQVPVAALQSDVRRVPETMKLDKLLGDLREHGYQMAVVVDEYGGTAGVATLEDLVEELIGEVFDEHDRARSDVVRREDGTWLTFSGALRPDELLDRAGIKVPEGGPYETVAGWMMSELGRIARRGDTLEIDGGVFRVMRMEGRRIDRIRFTPSVPDASREEER